MNTSSPLQAVYGAPPRDVVDTPAGAQQVSPHIPGALRLEDLAEGSLQSILIQAPPGTVERRYAMALAIRALHPDGRLTIAAPKDKGGSRLRKELEGFGCKVVEEARRHHRICECGRPAIPLDLDAAIAEGGPRQSATLDLWTQPGVFSWDRIDPGSALLVKHLPAQTGKGADLGAGIGYLSRAILLGTKVESLVLVDNDRRAIEAARRNVDDPRARFAWADVREPGIEAGDLDFVVMNPPFHDGGAEDKQLGQTFIRQAAKLLRRSGTLWLVANRHLPYESVLAEVFKTSTPRADVGGYKIIEARK